ncbi:AMP-binding protein [Paracoccus laeviglucosivorans]|uniref:Crotonobetaine/carnitine-CoA ligase n=1 Tax=Paracoccus laeviglucosivorans TaxID=1197861 RepID=A0A521ERK5_9RHOB|nr:AMP-binding protein [Paracoccus laeviglucosivorans]SMO86545.1 crotonobetaine/carnitine-CoA ligase [Paracoccus laeviglucosivorans]
MKNSVAMDPIDHTLFRDTLAARAIEEPNTVFLRFGDDTYTIGQINAASNRVANALLGSGLKPGDRVGLMLPSHPDHIIAIFATMKAGLVRVPVNVHAKGPSLEHYFTAYDLAALVADDQYRAQLDEAFVEVAAPAIIWRGSVDGRGDNYEALVAQASDAEPDVCFDTDDILALTPSSGTTGAPKGVLKSDRTLRAGPMAVLKITDARPGDVFLLWEPLHHGAGVAVIISAVLGKVTLAMVERFSVSNFWNDVRRYGVTHIHYLGGVLPLLLKQPPSDQDRDHKVRIAWGGGCPPEIWRDVEERFGVTLREGYGLSELITFVTLNLDRRVGSCGVPLSLYDLKVVDDDGQEVAAGEVGEIVAKSKQPETGFLGYFRNEETTRDTQRDGWLLTGDLARRDEDGFIFYAGRKKEMLRRRGINISAWEVEQVVNKHAAVAECALIGVPSELGEDDLKIVIRLIEGASLDPMALIEFCEARMPYYQVPRYVEEISEFPKTPTQRIRKKELSRSVSSSWDLEATGRTVSRKPVKA